MDKTYNGRPLRAGFIQNFSSLSFQELTNIKADLGLSLSTDRLEKLKGSFSRTDGRVTTDELYMADAFADSCSALSSSYSFAEMRTSSENVKNAFADLMTKRCALGDCKPVNHATLTDVYSRYLISAGYDKKSDRPYPEYDIKEKHLTGLPESGRHVLGNLFACEESAYAIAKTDAAYKFNVKKERIYSGRNSGIYHLLLIKLDSKPFAFEELANVINSSAMMSKDIIYCAKVATTGLFSALLSTNHGYVINIDTVSALIGEELRPFDLSRPMNCAFLLVPAEVSQNIAVSILNFGYKIRFVGYTTDNTDSFSVLYSGIHHELNTKAVKALLPEHSSVITVTEAKSEKAFLKSVRVRENISLTVFSHLTFSEIYEAIKSEIEAFKADEPEKKIYAYLVMPVVTLPQSHDHDETLGELLGIYRALAENAIPLVKYEFIPQASHKSASFFLVCDE